MACEHSSQVPTTNSLHKRFATTDSNKSSFVYKRDLAF